MEGNIACNIYYSDGRSIRKDISVSGDKTRDYLANLVDSLAAIKEDVNSILTEQVVLEKQDRSHINKRDISDEDEGI